MKDFTWLKYQAKHLLEHFNKGKFETFRSTGDTTTIIKPPRIARLNKE